MFKKQTKKQYSCALLIQNPEKAFDIVLPEA